ncbi:tape measure protein [Listeria booriae]|uniref:tape measure protein n=1 Tax=Listeria booriae TaxID=1552123 RepID=UPI001626D36B|nr:tape measure protein [Listeria booriae]MBC1982771.1 tape measure protein [Listeria booriae]
MSDGSVIIEISLDADDIDKGMEKVEKDFIAKGKSMSKNFDAAFLAAHKKAAESGQKMKTSMINAMKAGMDATKNMIKSATTSVLQMPKHVQSAVKAMVSTMKSSIQNVVQSVTTGVKNLGTNIKQASTNLRTGFTNAFNFVKTSSQQAMQVVANTLKSLPSSAASALTSLKTSFVSGFNNIKATVKSLPEAARSAGAATSSALKTAFSAGVAAAKTAGQNMKMGIQLSLISIKNTAATAMNGVKNAFLSVGRGVKNVGVGIKNGFVTAFNGIKNAAKNASAAVNESFKKSIQEPAEEAKLSVMRLAAAFGLIVAAKGVIGSAISRVDTIDTASKSLTVLTGSAEKAKLVMTDLVAAIDGTPIALDAVALGAKKMVAAGMEAANVKPVFTAIADAAYGVGNGSESIDQMVDAISSLQSAGVAYSDDINRLVDAGIPAWQILANSTGKSVGDMKKYVSEGSLDSKKAIAALVKGIEEGTTGIAGNTAKMAGLAKTAGNTISGAFGNMRTAAVKSMANIVDNLKDPIISALSGLQAAFKKLAAYTASPEFQAKLTEFVAKFKEMLPVIKEVAPIILKVAAAFFALQAVSGIFEMFGKMLGVFAPLKKSLLLISQGFLSLGKFILNPVKAIVPLLARLRSFIAVATPVGLIITAVTAAFIGMYQAFKQNTANIKGFMSSAFEGIKKSFSGLISVFKQIASTLKPVTQGLGGLLKYVGVGAFVAFTVVLAGLVDILRILASVVLAAIKSLQGLYYAAKAGIQALSGNLKGAKESIKQSGQAFSEAGSIMVDAFNPANSAVVQTISSMKELGKETDATGSITVDAMQKSSKAVQENAKQTEKAVSDSTKRINVLLEGGIDQYGTKHTAQTTAFLKAAKDLYSNYQKDAETAQKKYAEAMTKAESASGDERKQIIETANKELADTTKLGNNSLISLNLDYSKMLKENRWIDGKALTDQQKEFLKQQTEDIRVELAKQNQMYAEANLNRIKNGKSVSTEEQQLTLSIINDSYASRKEAVSKGEKELANLEKAQREAKTQVEKDALGRKILDQKSANDQVLTNLKSWSGEMNIAMANGSKLTADSFANGLKSMGKVTDEQLGLLFQSFVVTSGSIDSSLGALGVIMEQRGGQNIKGFTDALVNGDFPAAGMHITEGVIDSINKLPPQMFVEGEKGRNEFLKAIKSNQYQEAGKYLNDGVKTGLEPFDAMMAGKGKSGGDQLNNNLKGKQKGAENAGKTLASKAEAGAKAVIPKLSTVGGTGGQNLVDGLDNKKSAAYNAGAAVSNSGKSGAQSVGGWDSVGSNMGAGISAGLRSAAESVGTAAANVVRSAMAAAQREGQIKSPSRLMRDQVGKYLAEGVAVGMDRDKTVVKSAKNMALSAVTATQEALEIHSPSRVMQSLGEFVGQGLANGISGTQKQVAKTATTLAKKLSDAINSGLTTKATKNKQMQSATKTLNAQQRQMNELVAKRTKTANKISSLNAQMTKAPKKKKSGFAKQIESAKKQMQSYNSSVRNLQDRINNTKAKIGDLGMDRKTAIQAAGLKSIQAFVNNETRKLNAIAKQRDTVTAKLKDANKKLADLVKDSQKYSQEIMEKTLDYASITNVAKTGVTGDKIKQALTDRYNNIKEFTTNIAKLRKMGVHNTIIQDIVEAGVDGGAAYAKALAVTDKKTISSINAMQNKVATASKSLGSTSADQMYKAGIDAAKGLVKGLDSQQKALDAAAKRVANTITSSVRKALKIHSPSRVMRDDVGRYIPQGIAAGIDADAKLVEKALQSIRISGVSLPKITPESVLGLKTSSPRTNTPIQVNVPPAEPRESYNDAQVIALLKQLVEKDSTLVVNSKVLAEVVNNESGSAQSLLNFMGGIKF